MPYGPNLFQAANEAAPGKQPFSVARPAGVGDNEVEVNGTLVETIWLLKPPNKNTLFLTNGPPMVKPLNSLLLRGGVVIPLQRLSVFDKEVHTKLPSFPYTPTPL